VNIARRLLCASLLLWAGVPTNVLAHESRPAYLEINEISPAHYEVLWRTPVLSNQPLLLGLQFPDGVENVRPPVIQDLGDSMLERRWIDAGPGGLDGKRIDLVGLQLTITDALVKVTLLDGREWMTIARPNQPYVEIQAAPDTFSTVVEFLKQGAEHILGGPDHLVFVFGLLLLVGSNWMLVKTVTSFTVAHSITLVAATLGYVNPPMPPIEAAIALSILFLGIEIMRAREGLTSLGIRHPWVVAFAFGLLHGFGFASALSSAGLPAADIPAALVSFNVGVELGQLAFVGVVLLAAAGLRALPLRWPKAAELLPAYVVGSLGAFWTVQRLVTL
jgi:hydrogenase/urease accessory protein HupE